jgi:gamma-glutamyltranspeptidase/glutathione hydrolase
MPLESVLVPRVCRVTGMRETCFLEEGISESVRKQLRAMGHEAEIVAGSGRSVFGRGQMIRSHFQDGVIVFSAEWATNPG